jgi:hypothetical protein
MAFEFDLQMFGGGGGGLLDTIGTVLSIAAIPLTAGASAWGLPALLGPGLAAAGGLASAGGNSENQSQAAKASQALTGQQNATISQEQGLAGQIAQGPDLSSLINAGRSGIETLKQTGTGTPNMGAMIQWLLGTNQQNAMETAANTHTGNLNTAAGILGNTNSQLGGLNQQATAAATAGGNPWTSALGSISGLFPKPGTGSTATGPGGQAGGDIPSINWPSGYTPSAPSPSLSGDLSGLAPTG